MGSSAARARDPAIAERPVYFISDRPEAYEVFGEVSHDEAKAIGRTIADRAAAHFRGIEFRIDGAWHSHPPGTERVAVYIESHWQDWAAEALGRR